MPSARSVLSVDSSPVNGGARERFYRSSSLRLPSNTFGRFEYLRPVTPSLPVDVSDASGHALGTLHAPAG